MNTNMPPCSDEVRSACHTYTLCCTLKAHKAKNSALSCITLFFSYIILWVSPELFPFPYLCFTIPCIVYAYAMVKDGWFEWILFILFCVTVVLMMIVSIFGITGLSCVIDPTTSTNMIKLSDSLYSRIPIEPFRVQTLLWPSGLPIMFAVADYIICSIKK